MIVRISKKDKSIYFGNIVNADWNSEWMKIEDLKKFLDEEAGFDYEPDISEFPLKQFVKVTTLNTFNSLEKHFTGILIESSALLSDNGKEIERINMFGSYPDKNKKEDNE